MTERTLPDWKILASTARFFPVNSMVLLRRKQADSSQFDLEVDWEKEFTLKLFSAEFPDFTLPAGTAGTFRGEYVDKTGRKTLFVVTVCPGKEPETKRHLCGRLFDPGRGDEATGVWVAEEQRLPPPTDPADPYT